MSKTSRWMARFNDNNILLRGAAIDYVGPTVLALRPIACQRLWAEGDQL